MFIYLFYNSSFTISIFISN